LGQTLSVDPADAVPIWRQIEGGIRRLIALGNLRAGAAVPSVRDLAQELGVNPMTVAKAYRRLTDGGILVVKRGEGTFVADSQPHVGRADRTRGLREAAERFVTEAASLAASEEDAVAEVRATWARLTRGGTR
jgi:DNA-binding transcriptional regulator YhcF (GntR family)